MQVDLRADGHDHPSGGGGPGLIPLWAGLAPLLVELSMATPGCSAGRRQPDATATASSERGNIVVTIVCDNYPGRKDLTSIWGFACVIEGLDRTILFDTGGDGRVLLENMRALRIDPKAIDVVVLSHAHGDHTGGLAAFLRTRGGLEVYMAEGFPASLKKTVGSAGGKAIEAPRSVQICPDAISTGTLGQRAVPEHGLCIRTAGGWLLITGCAHPGIAEMAELSAKAAGEPVVAVMGGFHMGAHSPQQVQAVIRRLEALGVRRAMPCHCSGDGAREQFERHFGRGCQLPGVGSVLEFNRRR